VQTHPDPFAPDRRPRRGSTAAALGVGALVLASLAAAPASAAPRSGALPQLAASSTAYSAFSSGDIAYANAANLPPIDVAVASTGQTAAGVGVHGGTLTLADQLKQPLLSKSTSGKTAYGHGSAVNVGLLSAAGSTPQLAQTLAEATSPAPSSASGGNTVPAAPLLTAHVLPGSAVANTTADGSCVLGKDLSNGAAHVVDATLLDAGAAATVGVIDGTSDSLSRTALYKGTGNYGVLGQTTLNLAPLTVLKGTPLETRIEVLRPIQLTAQAAGTPGSAKVSYGAPGASGTTPVVKVTIAGSSQTLTSQQVFGDRGYVIPLGAADITIGGKAHSLTGLEGTSPALAASGPSASAAVDFVRVTVPGTLATPGTDPLDGPLSPLNAALNPLLSGLSAITGPIGSALASAGLNLADLRQGHLEASASVPVGGVVCDSGPLDESMKDVSALHVAPGDSFTYAIRIPNRGASDVTDVKVVDTYDSRLQFASSVPAPASHSGNTLTYNLGTLHPNDFRTIVMTFTVPDDAVKGTVYRNDAVITGVYNGQPISKPVGVDGPTVGGARSGPCNLSGSTKYASNTRVMTGEDFGYFVNVLNSGSEPCRDTTVTDTLIDGVTFVSCSDSCTHDGQDVTWKLGTVAPGQSRVLYVIVKVTATSGRLPNTAKVSSPSGTGGNPATPGPLVTDDTVPSPGLPADGPVALPRTGLPVGIAVTGLLLLGGLAVLRRRTA
jgi:uncharacterized repeat protein (TIGR01451 family)